jgi:hypothetical protein
MANSAGQDQRCKCHLVQFTAMIVSGATSDAELLL